MMLEIAKAGSSASPVSMTAIARGTDISKSYLEQLAIPLKASGLLHGRTGRAGGYTLAKPAEDIRLREIVESTIGPIDLVECVSDPNQCLRSPECETRLIWALVTNRIRSMLDEYSLADLTNPEFLQFIREEIGPALVMPRKRAGAKVMRKTCGPEPTRTRSRKRASPSSSS